MERTITADAVPQAKTRTMTNFRWKIAFLIFLISFVAYMDRVNLSVATPVIPVAGKCCISYLRMMNI